MRESRGMRGWKSSGVRESSGMRGWKSRGMQEIRGMRGLGELRDAGLEELRDAGLPLMQGRVPPAPLHPRIPRPLPIPAQRQAASLPPSLPPPRGRAEFQPGMRRDHPPGAPGGVWWRAGAGLELWGQQS